MSPATTLVSVIQQLAIWAGVTVGAFSVELTLLMRKGRRPRSPSDFEPGLHRRRADLGVVGDRVRADAVGCRPPGIRP